MKQNKPNETVPFRPQVIFRQIIIPYIQMQTRKQIPTTLIAMISRLQKGMDIP